MEKEVKTWHILIFTALVAWMIFMIYSQPKIVYKTNDVVNCNEDSLQQVISQQQIDLENEEDGWDNKEKRYEQILFEYEFGLDHLKHYHPEAYRDFHRIIGYKEDYSHDTERENKKRLNIKKW